MKTKLFAVLLVLAISLPTFAGGSKESATGSSGSAMAPLTAPLMIPGVIAEPPVITTNGPDGSVATWYDKLQLTPEEVQKIRKMNLTAAFEMVTDSDWSRANLKGFQDAAKILNIKVVGISSCQLDPIKQKQNMEDFIALNPNIITCQPQDLNRAAATFDPLVAKKIKLVFLSNVPTGYKPGVQYVSAITDSLKDMGAQAADLMNKALGGTGDIITIDVAGVNYVTNTRDAAFKAAIQDKYPGIHIVAEGGFQALSEAGPQATGLLTKYPNVKGIYVSFSGPAVGVLDSVRALGRKDVKIVTMDLDTVAALDMVQGGNTYGIVADSPYSMGFGRAILGAYGELGKAAPSYVASPAFEVMKSNLVDGWKWSLGSNPPDSLMKAMGK